MQAQAILEKLEELLEEERMAIRTLKGARVHGIACEKLELMKALEAIVPEARQAFGPRVKEVVRRLRHNSVLLVHAKSILAEALRIKKARLASPVLITMRPEAKSKESRFSVVG
jgi:flagellar biosynthesis/type III secretory pathway chaperone